MFKVGDKITMVREMKTDNSQPYDPVYGKIYVFDGYDSYVDVFGRFVFIAGINQVGAYGRESYREDLWVKVDESFAEGVLAEIKEQIEEEELVKV